MMWLLVIVVVVTYLLYSSRRPPGFPPGPRCVPIVGNLPLVLRLRRQLGFTHLVWQRLSATYGPLIGLRLGRDSLVVANGYNAVRDILSRPEFDARPDGFFFRLRSFGKRLGLVFVEGDYFTEQKRFVMTHLKSFGLNRSAMEDRISDEIHDLFIALKKKGPVSLPDSFGVSVVNSLWGIVAGDRFKVDDTRPATLLSHISTVFRLQDMSGGILNQMPYLRFIAPDLSQYNRTKMIVDTLTSFLQELIEEHRKSHSQQNADRDLIDAYLREIAKRSGTDSPFTEDQLVILLLDLFLAGAETTNSTLSFAILYLLHFPEWQTIMQEEIDSVVAPGERVQMKHKPNMKHVEVYLMELQRHANVTTTTISHRASQDTEFMGYHIHKDTVILANLYSLHMDKEHWTDPEVFRPERFFGADKTVVTDPWFMPFGFGKRKCLGESLAKTSLFLFLTNVLHEFTISSVPGRPIPTLRGLDGATLSPQKFQCVFTPRQTDANDNLRPN